MRLIFLGPPGAGKGTYSSRICQQKGWAHISTGDILRENVKNQTEIGMNAKEYIDRGELVPDDIIINMVKERLKLPDAQPGFIFDGFPRTIAQAEELEKITPIDTVINLVIPDWVLIQKILARRTCEKCGEVYNITDITFGPNNSYHMPPIAPKQEGICDKCGGVLISRSDETEEIIKNRLEVYKKETERLIFFYRERRLLKDFEIKGPPEKMVTGIIGVIEGNPPEQAQPAQQTQQPQQPPQPPQPPQEAPESEDQVEKQTENQQ